MKASRRAKRLMKNAGRSRGEEGLILTSVIDIFTILVLYLLVHMGDEQAIQNTHSIKLPDSSSDQKPATALIVSISSNDIVVQGHSVMDVNAAKDSTEDVLPPLLNELNIQRDNRITKAAADEKNPAIVLADRDIPYRLLKKIMYTLAEAQYTEISLAVVEKE